MDYIRPTYMILNAVMLEFYLYRRCFKHVRCPWLFLWIMAARIFNRIFVGQFLYDVYGRTTWVMQLDWFVATTYIMFLVCVLIYMFHDAETSILKILFFNMFIDMLNGVMYSTLLVVINVLSHRETLDAITGVWMMPDTLVLFFTVSAVFLLHHFGGRLFAILQDVEITHVKMITLISFSYPLLGVMTSINLHEAKIYYFGYIVYALYAVFLLALIIYDHRMIARNRHFDEYTHMLQLHYQTVSASMMDIAKQQQEIETMMAQLSDNDFPPDRTRDYLAQLTASKDILHTTMFTDYYIIDALLSAKAHDYAQAHVSYDFHLTDLQLQHITQFTLCELLTLLFDYVDSLETHEISLKIATLHKQIVVAVEIDQLFNKRHMKKLLKGYGHDIIYDVADHILTLAIVDKD